MWCFRFDFWTNGIAWEQSLLDVFLSDYWDLLPFFFFLFFSYVKTWQAKSVPPSVNCALTFHAQRFEWFLLASLVVRKPREYEENKFLISSEAPRDALHRTSEYHRILQSFECFSQHSKWRSPRRVKRNFIIWQRIFLRLYRVLNISLNLLLTKTPVLFSWSNQVTGAVKR